VPAPRAVIFGCAGADLSPEEAAFFRAADPWGFILFKRNVETPEQVKRLTRALREAVGRDSPVLVDQEGGTVARFRGAPWKSWPPALTECDAVRDEANLLEALRLRYRIIALELTAMGVDVNCVPLLDVPQAGSSDVIGVRALGRTPEEVARRGRAVVEGSLAGGALPVVKHLPGHGRTQVDTHEARSVVGAPRAELEAVDFPPFHALRDASLGMTAHIYYDALDPDHPATQSPLVIEEVIRGEIGFDGILMTDDLSMSALSGAPAERAVASVEAGCDVALHCNGELLEMRAVADALPRLSAAAQERAERADVARHEATLRARFENNDIEALWARHQALIGEELAHA